jgi:LigD-like primase-polymerase
VPLNTAVAYHITQPSAKAIADLLSQQHPRLIVAEMAKVLRKGKVFIDWSQNVARKSRKIRRSFQTCVVVEAEGSFTGPEASRGKTAGSSGRR